jgi:hypothetical protein
VSHPLLRLAAAQPQWLLAHLAAYLELVADEGQQLARLAQQRLLWRGVAVLCAAVAAVLAGVALLLAGLLPAPATGLPLWWWAVPAAPLAGAVWAWRAAVAVDRPVPWAELRTQLAADAALLRAASPP